MRSTWILTLLWTSLTFAAPSIQPIDFNDVVQAFPETAPAHPRLFMNTSQCQALKEKIPNDPTLKAFTQALYTKADALLNQKPLTRKLTGRRLLSVSRTCLDRIFTLSMAYRLSNESTYRIRAQQEMLSAAAFTDWNPSHFLDVAEMCAALAIGYDWLYQDLAPQHRALIKQAILTKGLDPSFKVTHWVRGHNNWNQVCNGGITLGALALLEDAPDMAHTLVHRAVNGVQVVMSQYEPDGAYPEGPGYWIYGTSYNVLLLAALNSVLGTDFGLSQKPGFSKTAEYYLHVTGPTGRYFNYPDSGSHGSLSPTVLWFAHHYQDPSLAWYQHRLIQEGLKTNSPDLLRSRLSPLALLWLPGEVSPPMSLSWMGQGSNPVAMFRSSWTDPNAVYLGFKGGSPGVSHGHMDIGSFVIDAGGVRWALDLGPESYNKIESLGMNLWGRDQKAERWTIFRYNNLSHNTLVVNGSHQQVKGHAPIIRYSNKQDFPHVVIDMSTVYKGQLKTAYRGASLLPDGRILIQDEFKASKPNTTVRWAMVTPAMMYSSGQTLTLKQKDQILTMHILGVKNVEWQTYSSAPRADYDAPNPNTRMVGFEINVNADQPIRIAVVLDPQNRDLEYELKPILTWSEALKP